MTESELKEIEDIELQIKELEIKRDKLMDEITKIHYEIDGLEFKLAEIRSNFD